MSITAVKNRSRMPKNEAPPARKSRHRQPELWTLLTVVSAAFLLFLFVPLALVIWNSFNTGTGQITLSNYAAVLHRPDFIQSVINSLIVSALGAGIAVGIAFLLAYTVNATNVPRALKRIIKLFTQLPMLLPTITYGFAIIYSFGKHGLITRIFGFQLFNIYGFNGLLIGYVVYTLPTCFLLIHNSFQFVDKKFIIVSHIMGDRPLKTFLNTVVRPLVGTMCVAFIQSFFLAFTDYGIPTSVGGEYDVLAMTLYNQMLGSIPNFHRGAVIAVFMLIPSIISIILMTILERYSIRYAKISQVDLPRGVRRDFFCGAASILSLGAVLSLFLVIIIIPFVSEWPFNPAPTLRHITALFTDPSLNMVYTNSLYVAVMTAIVGCLFAYATGLVTSRSRLPRGVRRVVDSISAIVNTVPGMVLGIAFLLTFSGTSLQNTFWILIVANVVHYFATPYQMIKDSLTKMNASWETTARLMGDSWFKTILRVITPNAWPTILQVFGYYFVNAMVTISAVVFLTGARTQVVTTEISALQHIAKFDSVFALSLLILVTNLLVKGGIALATRNRRAVKAKKRAKSNIPVNPAQVADTRTTVRRDSRVTAGKQLEASGSRNFPLPTTGNRKARNILTGVFAAVLTSFLILFGTGALSSASATRGQVVIYTNADDEAVVAFQNALDKRGMKGQYIVQNFGTSELGGKILAEGKALEADVITMSSYYIDSAQHRNSMFLPLTDIKSRLLGDSGIAQAPKYRRPATAQEGALLINKPALKAAGVPAPKSLKDLADPKYEGLIAVPDMEGSSTGWLMVQAIVDAYGLDGEGKQVMTGIARNAGPHMEQSGSGPLKAVRSGEVAIGFGLRHQAVADKAQGLPIDYVDPVEGNYSLTESVAVLDKGESTNPKAQKVAAILIDEGRQEILSTYPTPLYEGEHKAKNASVRSKFFPQPLTVDLLQKHQDFSSACKRAAGRK
ncbi:ABC transporter permease subunit [Gleimia hominis]|uniref:ABC transporter permease subunit n=1 Tax=Gleimia hominis TaxID=595468 RepID=A0ABU3I8Q4_9ACTO|nr:extracellular solute-binding protein [Gleimia hominis]MDT3766751.1 ABC transporter permease subunit [Gleimia hominis]